jgi:hypothetical protein
MQEPDISSADDDMDHLGNAVEDRGDALANVEIQRRWRGLYGCHDPGLNVGGMVGMIAVG